MDDSGALCGVITINSGKSLTFTVDIVDDGLLEGDETLLVKLSDPVNAALGMKAEHNVSIVERNLAPQLQLFAEQQGHH